MKLITAKGELALPNDFSFTIEENSPFFSTEGSQSIPATLPASADTIDKLGQPFRIGRRSKFIRRIPAKLSAGVIHKDGQLVIDKGSVRSGIVGALMLNESDLYSKIKDQQMKEVFGKIIRNDFASAENKVLSWYNYLFSVYTGAAEDDFTLFPVAVNKNDTAYQLLNDPEYTSTSYPWPLKWESRAIYSGSDTINVPAGYGITPFLYLYRVIELLFSQFDYTVRANPFRADPLLKKIVVLNSCADTICTGVVNYSNLVPSITIAEFIQFLNNKYHAQVFVYPESKCVDIRFFESILNESADLDITAYVDGDVSFTYSDQKQVNLVPDNSIEDAAPAMDTFDELAAKYPFIKELDESGFRNDAYKYSIVYRKATGEYFEILRREGDNTVKRKRLGSNYFRYFKKTMTAEEILAKDKSVPMILKDVGLVGYKMAIVLAPYVRDAVHFNTSYTDEKQDSAQALMVCYAVGSAEENNVTIAKYNFGSTQKFNNLGNLWGSVNINYDDYYPLFWKGYNELLMNSGISLSMKVNYSISDLMSFRLDKLKLYQNSILIPVKRSYNIGRVITHNESEFLSAKALDPVITDVRPVQITQTLTWELISNLNEILSEWDGQEWPDVYWEYDPKLSDDEFFFLPPPTQEQLQSGNTFYNVTRMIKVFAKRYGESEYITFTRVLDSAFRPIQI